MVGDFLYLGMKTKLLLLFLTSFCATSQTLEKLKSETKKLHDANYTMDFDAIAALTYPKVYESNGIAAFTEKLDTDYANEEFRKRLQIVDPIFVYSELKIMNDKKFYVITYKNPVRYFFENKMDSPTAQQKANALKASTMAHEVVVEPKRNSVNVKRNSKFIAISDENTNGEWRFFNFDDVSQRALFDALIGADVKKALGLSTEN